MTQRIDFLYKGSLRDLGLDERIILKMDLERGLRIVVSRGFRFAKYN
jgi:hypothetical protein